MQFLYQPLTWGFLLVGVPILVHLINMLRHRKVKWAAMDFLLDSYRRNRRWVMLKQWLLLLSRILAMLLLVAMLAKWVSGSRWLSNLGAQTTHHYVLLDDSYSMGEVQGGETVYQRGLAALAGLVRQISVRPGQHQLTLLRWSRADLALRNTDSEARIDSAADLLGQSVPRDPAKLLDRISATEPTSLALSPSDPLELVAPLIAENPDQRSEVYLITDMRRNEFGETDELRNQLQALHQNATKLHVVDCSSSGGENLSIVSIEPSQEVWAAGVPLMVRFQVRNRTSQIIKNAIVRVRFVTYAEGVTKPQLGESYSGEIRDEPAVVIEQISPGETVTRQVQAVFAVPGNHVIEVALEDDVLDADNRRWCTVQIEQQQKVLLVDGDVEQRNAFFIESVVNPNPRLSTGISVDKRDTAYLRDTPLELLATYDVIALLDVPRFDPQAVTKLEQYCQSGGGLLHLCGPNTNLKFTNEQLYREGRGIFPMELSGIARLQPPPGEPQVVAQPHPILAPLLQLSSSPFMQLQIRQLLEGPSLQDPRIETVATAAAQPLVVDQPFGQGRVVTVLTGLPMEWSNWAQDPTFVVLTLRTLGYLGSFRRPPTSMGTAEPMEMVIAGESILPEAEVLLPARGDAVRMRLQQTVEQPENEELSRLSMAIDLEGSERDLINDLLRPGVFEAWMTTAQGEPRVKNFARNVPAIEGELDRVSAKEFEQGLGGIPIEVKQAQDLGGSSLSSPESVQSTLLMALLALLLLGEQALAYSASYHAAPAGVRG